MARRSLLFTSRQGVKPRSSDLATPICLSKRTTPHEESPSVRDTIVLTLALRLRPDIGPAGLGDMFYDSDPDDESEDDDGVVDLSDSSNFL